MRTIGIVTETLGNVIEMLIQLPTIIIRICYYISQLNIFLQVWADFLECRKCNILVITQALVLCLTYTHSPLGVVRIYQAKHSCLCYNLYIYLTNLQ